MGRFHVCTYQRESCVNRESRATEDEAHRRRRQREEEQDRANLDLRQQHAAALRASILDLEDADDSVPAAAPFQYAYRFTVEPCTEGERCLACLEAGLI